MPECSKDYIARIERRLILTCALAIVLRLYDEHWGQFGGLAAVGLCMGGAVWITYLEHRRSLSRGAAGSETKERGG